LPIQHTQSNEWLRVPESTKLALPVIGAFVEACYRQTLSRELTGVLARVDLARDWQIAGMEVRNYDILSFWPSRMSRMHFPSSFLLTAAAWHAL